MVEDFMLPLQGARFGPWSENQDSACHTCGQKIKKIACRFNMCTLAHFWAGDTTNSPFLYVVQSLSRVQLFATPWTAAHQASLSFTISQSLLKLMSIESVMPSNHLIFCHPLLLSFPASGSSAMSWLFASGSQSIGASASASVLAVSIMGQFPLGLTGLISLQSTGLSSSQRVFSSTTIWKH